MIPSTDRAARILVAYYSATGHVHALANAVAEGAEAAGAEVRLRPVEELAPEQVISRDQAWGWHRSEVNDEPTASLADLDWADGMAFGTPTRFGNVAAQLKMFLNQAGQRWEQGKLINNVATAFTSSQTVHGGQESTILALNTTFYHWGTIVLPLGYTVHEVFNGGGNPYGTSFTSGTRVGPPDHETTVVAVAQRRARAGRRVRAARGSGQLLGANASLGDSGGWHEGRSRRSAGTPHCRRPETSRRRSTCQRRARPGAVAIHKRPPTRASPSRRTSTSRWPGAR
jgi:NAD(P)H dehydrogenase (quinone)